jgi:hypothetical protein
VTTVQARSIKALLAGAIASCLATVAVPAQAQSVPGTAYFGYSPNNITLSVPVRATIGSQCGFATGAVPTTSLNVGQIDTTGWTRDVAFTLECTGPSRIAILSSNGGLKTTGTVTDPGYLGLAPYNVAVNVVRTGGTTTGNCAAADLLSSAATACALRGTASTTVGLHVTSPSFGLAGSYVRVSAPAYPGPGVLVAGTYNDTLTVTISPAA